MPILPSNPLPPCRVRIAPAFGKTGAGLALMSSPLESSATRGAKLRLKEEPNGDL
jgi:hypothetical protein